MKLFALLALLTLALPSARAYAADPDDRAPLERLAKKYDVSADQLRALRAQKMGWGEIGDALAISKKANVPLADVLAQRKSGMGWGQIAKSHGFTLGSVVRNAHAAARDGERAEHERGEAHEERGEREHGREHEEAPEHGGPPEHEHGGGRR